MGHPQEAVRRNILRDYLERKGGEVLSILMTEYDYATCEAPCSFYQESDLLGTNVPRFSCREFRQERTNLVVCPVAGELGKNFHRSSESLRFSWVGAGIDLTLSDRFCVAKSNPCDNIYEEFQKSKLFPAKTHFFVRFTQ